MSTPENMAEGILDSGPEGGSIPSPSEQGGQPSAYRPSWEAIPEDEIRHLTPAQPAVSPLGPPGGVDTQGATPAGEPPPDEAALQRWENEGGRGANEPPERGPGLPRGPERGPEWETSPERGRVIVREIIRLETTLDYRDRYKEQSNPDTISKFVFNPEVYNTNEPYLDQLYKDLQDYTRAVRRVRNLRETDDPWDPLEAYREITEALERRARGESPEVNQLGISRKDRGERPSALPAESLNALFEKYIGNIDTEVVEGDLATWFQEARNLGLLDRADDLFTSLHRKLIQGNIPAEETEQELLRMREYAKGSIEGLLRSHRTDPRAAALRGIAEAYSARTYDIFEKWLSGERYVPIEGEFRFSEDIDEEDTKKYWVPGHYPKLYEIIAKTKKQFNRAKDTFLSMITGGALGESPDELYEHFNNFTEKFRQTAGSEGMDNGYIISSALEIGGRGFVFGGDYSLETYNMKSANQFLMAMALHKGPQRWLAVARSGRGGVAPHLWKFDYDPRVKLMHNPGGSRGQLLNDTVTQHYLHQEIRNILIEEGIGVVLKDYDPRDGRSVAYDPESIRVLNLPEAELKREHALQANMARIGIHQPVEEFKGLYEGFDKGNAHLINYRSYQNWNDDQLKTLAPSLRRSVIIGKVQSLLLPHDGKDKDRLLKVIDKEIVEKRLTARDKRYWEEAYDQSKANFATAFQMVGATGEKARRGGGVFFIDRKDEQGHRFVDNMPVYLGEMFIQYAETRTKIEFANVSAVARTKAVAAARKLAIEQIHTNGFEAALKVPKLLFDTNPNSSTFGDVIGTDGTEIIDFDAATDPENALNRWLNHTYLSYQPENRHQATNPDVLKAAKRRRMRLLRPDLMTEPESDEDQHETLADIRLILDPTLNRVLSLKDTDLPEGMSSQQAEILLSDAAVEALNFGHWRIVRELNAAFMPEDGNSLKMRTGYNLEDYSGIARFIIRMRQFVASNPNRFARRYAAEIANLPLNVSSMPDQWGQVGVLGAIEMFADPIGDMAEQKIASQFAITKWVEQMRIGNMLYGALVGQVDPERGFSVEGLFEKPTNNSDKLVKYWQQLKSIKLHPEAENEFFYALMESFDRLWIVLKLVRTMESDTRNAQGALDLEKKEVFIDGKVNPEIATDRNTGSSRHTERIFFNKYVDWLLSDKPGGGMATYPSEVRFYKFLREPYFYVNKDGAIIKDGRTWADWLFDKMSR